MRFLSAAAVRLLPCASRIVALLFLPLLTWQAAAQAPPAPGTAVAADGAPAWVHTVSRMGFCGAGELDLAARSGIQVVHTNSLWPYFPLRRDGGGPRPEEERALRELVEGCHRRGMRLSLGLPPFPSVSLLKQHPDWRVEPDRSGAAARREPREDDLGTRIGCNNGPWGNYLIELCVELARDYGIDGYSFDGNYHPPICYCRFCERLYREERSRELPAAVNLDDVAYREYLVWRGERLEHHYRELRRRLREARPGCAVMTWTTNAGRYGHLLTSPRVMPATMNRLIDLPMQEWWLDETNLGASVAPSFGAAYLRALRGGPCASEPYLMSRGNPYGSDSFPRHERLTRALLALTHGNVTAQSLGWPGHRESTAALLAEVKARDPWTARLQPAPWLGIVVSEQTRQFVAYRNIQERFLPHVFGAFRAAMEEHLPFQLLNDWDLTPEGLKPYRVLMLPNSAALSDAQCRALTAWVRDGGALVATGETSLFDELGRRRPDFGLREVLGASYRGAPGATVKPEALDANFAATLPEDYWQKRQGSSLLVWSLQPFFAVPRLQELVPHHQVRFKGPAALVEPTEPAAVLARFVPDGQAAPGHPALIARAEGKGRVVYLAASVEAGYWSYGYPYQRLLLRRCLEWAAGESPAWRVEAPMCVQTTFWRREKGGEWVVQLFNGLNTTGGHGKPSEEVPLREETVPIHGIRLRLRGDAPRGFRLEPGNRPVRVRRERGETVVELPPLEVHAVLVGMPSTPTKPTAPAGKVPAGKPPARKG